MNGTKEFGNPFSLERITMNANSALTAEDLSVAILSQPNKPSARMRLVLVGQKGCLLMPFFRSRSQSTPPIAGASNIGGIGIDQLRELRQLQTENNRLRRVFYDLTLDKVVLTEAFRGD